MIIIKKISFAILITAFVFSVTKFYSKQIALPGQLQDIGLFFIIFIGPLISIFLQGRLFGTNEENAPCAFAHANASPDIDACGATLPQVPDEETRNLILQHNKLDLLLYQSSQTMYELEKQILLGMEAD